MFNIYVKVSNFDEISTFVILPIIYAQIILSLLQICFSLFDILSNIQSASYNALNFGTGIAERLVCEVDCFLYFLMMSFDWKQQIKLRVMFCCVRRQKMQKLCLRAVFPKFFLSCSPFVQECVTANGICEGMSNFVLKQAPAKTVGVRLVFTIYIDDKT